MPALTIEDLGVLREAHAEGKKAHVVLTPTYSGCPAIDQMRGPAGTLVKLSVRRSGTEQLVNLALERAQVEVHSVAVEP